MIDLGKARKLVVLTGAGISVASGLLPYRGPDGLWTTNPALEAEVSSPELLENPPRIWELFGPLREQVRAARPNAGHTALARLEERYEVTLVTQNIDGLHTAAGSTDVVELHGNIMRTRCTQCEHRCDSGPGDCPECGAPLRPDIVLFGEPLPHRASRKAFQSTWDCDLFLAVGTSGTVSPASRLVREAKSYGARTILLNLTEARGEFDEVVTGKAEEILPTLITWGR